MADKKNLDIYMEAHMWKRIILLLWKRLVRLLLIPHGPTGRVEEFADLACIHGSDADLACDTGQIISPLCVLASSSIAWS